MLTVSERTLFFFSNYFNTLLSHVFHIDLKRSMRSKSLLQNKNLLDMVSSLFFLRWRKKKDFITLPFNMMVRIKQQTAPCSSEVCRHGCMLEAYLLLSDFFHQIFQSCVTGKYLQQV